MPKSVSAASSLDAAINSIAGQLKKHGLELVGTPSFGPQGNFTLCQVKVQRTRGKKVYVGTAVAKRSVKDHWNSVLGRQLALQRAIFGYHFNTCSDKENCSCWKKAPFSVMAKIKAEQETT